MRKMKKFLAFMLSAAMVLSTGMTAMAEGDGTTTNDGTATEAEPAAESQAAAPSGNLTVDDHIAVKGLQEKDSVKFYRILKWDNGWVADEGFTSLTEDEIKQIIGHGKTEDEDGHEVAAEKGKITSEMAGKLGGLAAPIQTAYYGPLTAAASGEVKQEKPDAGLYIALITPADTGYMYNPVFVAADYDQKSVNNEWTVDINKTYADEAMAKKTPIGTDKKASVSEDKTYADLKPETVAVGETVSFAVDTTIPKFASNYTNPVFKAKDELSAGLELQTDTLKVYAVDDQDAEELLNKNYFTVNPLTKTGFTISFNAAYLKNLGQNEEAEEKIASQKIRIKYDAVVTSEAVKSVNLENNTFTVNFSNSPDDEEGHGIMKDKTNHYTFNIDGDLFGKDPYKTTEVVKVGVDQDGNEITETRELDNGSKVGALQGAEFALYTDKACKEENLYKNTKHPNGVKVTSDADGRISIMGLDAGTYWLKETKAPAGYVKDPDAHEIKITAVIKEVDVTEKVTEGGKEYTVKYKTNVLESYSITIDGNETANYSVTNDATTTEIKEVTKGDNVGKEESGDAGKIKNTKGAELPATGGIGTTMFYVIGSVLVIGAGIVLVAKRRMSMN